MSYLLGAIGDDDDGGEDRYTYCGIALLVSRSDDDDDDDDDVEV
jgi:hypothetical protein